MKRISQLLHKPIYTQDGKYVGRVFNVLLSVTYDKDHIRSIEVSALLYGREGILRRFGQRKGSSDQIAWRQVVAMTKERIVVDKKT